jgi:hypothetical protein
MAGFAAAACKHTVAAYAGCARWGYATGVTARLCIQGLCMLSGWVVVRQKKKQLHRAHVPTSQRAAGYQTAATD